MTDATLGEQVEQFRDYHRAKGNKFDDINAAWRTWCRNHQKFNPPLKESSEPLQSYVPVNVRTHPEEKHPVAPNSPFKKRHSPTSEQRPRLDAWLKKAMKNLPPELEQDPHGSAEWIQEQMARVSNGAE
jgi:hypothetical protein